MSGKNSPFLARLAAVAAETEALLDRLLTGAPAAGELSRPAPREETHPQAAVRIELVNALARAAGLGGMAGGQMLDLAAEGRFGTVSHGESEVRMLQAMKTGALLRFACQAGGILGGASAGQRE